MEARFGKLEQGIETRLGKLESKTAKPHELTTKETEGITRLIMPQIEQAVRKALAAAQNELPPSTPSNATRRTPRPANTTTLTEKFGRGSSKKPIPVEEATPAKKKTKPNNAKAKEPQQKPSAQASLALFD